MRQKPSSQRTRETPNLARHFKLQNRTVCGFAESNKARHGLGFRQIHPSTGLWQPLNVPLPPAPLQAAGSSKDFARPASPSSEKQFPALPRQREQVGSSHMSATSPLINGLGLNS